MEDVGHNADLYSCESVATFQCGCDGGAQPKFIDPFGYHMVGCKIGANAICLHDEVVLLLAKLFRSLRLDAYLLRRREIAIVNDQTSCLGTQGDLVDKLLWM